MIEWTSGVQGPPPGQARLMRALPELMVLVKGMVNATKSVLSTLVLLIIFLSPGSRDPGPVSGHRSSSVVCVATLVDIAY